VEKEPDNTGADDKEIHEKVDSEGKEKTIGKESNIEIKENVKDKGEIKITGDGIKEIKVNKKDRTTTKGGKSNAPKGNTPLEKGMVVAIETTPKGKEKERETKLVNQRIAKFLTKKYTEKGTETDTPVGNRRYVGEKDYGSKGEVGSRNNSAKPDCNEPDTDFILNNKVGGADGRIGEKIELQQQQAVCQPAEQCGGSNTELHSLGCGYRFTDSLERRTEQCTERQRSAGIAD